MVTLALVGMLLSLALGVGFAILVRGRPVETPFRRICWTPLAALLLEALFFQPLAAALGYFAVALALLTCIVSLLLASAGATWVAAARRRGEDATRLLRATIVASLPGVLLAGYVAHALLVAFLGSER